MKELTVICQICGEAIGVIDLDTLRYPLNGDMFRSIAPEREILPPFYANAPWEDFRCPYGHHRPVVLPDYVLTNRGMYYLPEDGSAPCLVQAPADRETILDRELIEPKPPSDEQAANITRGEHGEAEKQQGQTEDGQPIETENKGQEADSWDNIDDTADASKPVVDISGNQPPQHEPVFVCDECGKQCANQSGLVNHVRIVHGRKISKGAGK